MDIHSATNLLFGNPCSFLTIEAPHLTGTLVAKVDMDLLGNYLVQADLWQG